MARKPHVAWFAGMEYVPIPYAERFTDFLAAADQAGADYLFISAIETGQHPQLSVLADPGVSLPGLVPVAHRVLGGSHYFALYRLVPTTTTAPAIEDSLLVAIRRFVSRRPGEPWPQTYLGGQLVTMGRFREALAPLAEAERLDPGDALVARFQTIAHAELGEHDAASAACERALRLSPSGTWEWGYLGRIRIAQRRYDEARDALRRAMSGEPANPRYPVLYLEASALGGFWEDAASVARRILAATPGDATARLIGARAMLRLGRPDQARTLIEMKGTVSGPDSAAFAEFADSVRRGTAAAP
jgi:predicted Zn-dependent protease